MKLYRGLLLMVLLPLVLTACGGGLSTGDAEKGIEALFSGNYSEAEKYVCKEVVDASRTRMDEAPEGTKVSVDATCREDGENMKCSMKMTIEENGTSNTQDIPETKVPVEDGKLCGEFD